MKYGLIKCFKHFLKDIKFRTATKLKIFTKIQGGLHMCLKQPCFLLLRVILCLLYPQIRSYFPYSPQILITNHFCFLLFSTTSSFQFFLLSIFSLHFWNLRYLKYFITFFVTEIMSLYKLITFNHSSHATFTGA